MKRLPEEISPDVEFDGSTEPEVPLETGNGEDLVDLVNVVKVVNPGDLVN